MKKLLTTLVAALVVSVAPISAFSAAEPAAFKDPQDRTRTLTGRVFDRQDQPLEKAVVYLKNTKSLVVKTYITDPDGSYRFPALSPNVDYEVYAEHNGARSDTKTLSAFDSRKVVNITLRVK
ncbi:MAG TPA: carboxypeptidase-like regulatory domain-containing protein [Candidatus Angelobacter sp.]